MWEQVKEPLDCRWQVLVRVWFIVIHWANELTMPQWAAVTRNARCDKRGRTQIESILYVMWSYRDRLREWTDGGRRACCGKGRRESCAWLDWWCRSPGHGIESSLRALPAPRGSSVGGRLNHPSQREETTAAQSSSNNNNKGETKRNNDYSRCSFFLSLSMYTHAHRLSHSISFVLLLFVKLQHWVLIRMIDSIKSSDLRDTAGRGFSHSDPLEPDG